MWKRSMFLAALILAATASAEATLPVIKATQPVVSIREGAVLRQGAWSLAPDLNPDVYEVELKDGASTRVTFITDVDSISFHVEVGTQCDFIIEYGKTRCATRIMGVRAIPAAVFDEAYRVAHRGKISVEVPEVYELVNVAIAMTPVGLNNRNLVFHDTDYYAAVRKWFDPFREHRAIAAISTPTPPTWRGCVPG